MSHTDGRELISNRISESIELAGKPSNFPGWNGPGKPRRYTKDRGLSG
jgi:hypothetical protein